MANEVTSTEVVDKLGMNDILSALDDDADTSEEKSESAEEIKLSDDAEDSNEEEAESEAKTEEEPEEEKELELKDESEEDELEFQNVPARKAILKEFPELFKKFPGIERAIFREDKYTQIFPSIKDAEDARAQLEGFATVQKDLLSGNIENLLKEVKTTDSKAFDKITARFLDTINAVDPQASLKIVNRITKSVLANVAAAGKKMEDKGNERGEQYRLAAHYLHEALYGDMDIKPPENEVIEDKPDPKQEELTRQQIEFNRQQLETAVDDVTTKVNRTLESAIKKYIDPKGLMSEYVREKAVGDVMKSFERDYQNDTRFRQHVDKLWVAARNSRFNEESKSKIRQAIIKRAQSSLKDHIKHVRSQALRSSTNKTVARRESRSEDKKLTPSSNASSSSNKTKPNRVGSVKDVMKFLE